MVDSDSPDGVFCFGCGKAATFVELLRALRDREDRALDKLLLHRDALVASLKSAQDALERVDRELAAMRAEDEYQ